MSGNTFDHPNSVLRREIELIKGRLEKLEKSMNITEQVMVEMVHKHNQMKDQLIKITQMLAQLESPKKKKSQKDTSSE